MALSAVLTVDEIDVDGQSVLRVTDKKAGRTTRFVKIHKASPS